MTSNEIRKRFLQFFEKKGHAVVPSDSLIPAKDPTLLFTGAGMNQFKEYFLGVKHDLKKAASCQKCFRTGDLEKVGLTASHLTFFEMLGNFSFGDYFKKEAIRYAWGFMTEELRLPEDRIWASIYTEDEEASQVWLKEIGLPPKRIVRFGAKENFWPSNAPTEGPNGPCGPCSELYYDYQRCMIGKTCPDPEACAPGCPCGRFVEVWNLVFTQFDRQEGGKLLPLPAKNIDTGMGLERLAAVIEERMSVFETDLFEPIIEAMVHLLRQEAPDTLRKDQRASVYAVCDHIRALSFLIGDGLVPSNEGRGYVLRMLLRKAARAGMSCGFLKPFLYKLVPAVTKTMEVPYPQLTAQRESIAKTILAEEERFLKTLREGRAYAVKEIARLKEEKKLEVPGELVFRWYDTYGFPLEEVEALAAQAGIGIDRRGFQERLKQQRQRSREASGFGGVIFAKDMLVDLVKGFKQPTEFLGYEEKNITGLSARVVGLIQEGTLVRELKAPAQGEVILDRSPFYGEAGGQVGDSGFLQAPEARPLVTDTQWVGNLLLHRVDLTEGRLRINDPVEAFVDQERRLRVAQNHTGTHLLHAALRRVLGSHVVQAGSLVAPDRIRFDFSHSKAVGSPELGKVESVVNEWIFARLPVKVQELPFDAARKAGALALFGEKYGEKVRMVSIGEVSRELCGGTHLTVSSEVGCLTIVEEGSVAAGIRRLEALTGPLALGFLKGASATLQELAQALKVPPGNIGEAAERLLKRVRQLEQELERFKLKDLKDLARSFEGKPLGPFALFIEQIPFVLDHAALRLITDGIRERESEAIVFLADSQGFCVATASGLAKAKGLTAVRLLQWATEVAGGSGGGRPELAQGRIHEMKDFSRIRDTLEKKIQEQVKG